jgi:hypothetical protein
VSLYFDLDLLLPFFGVVVELFVMFEGSLEVVDYRVEGVPGGRFGFEERSLGFLGLLEILLLLLSFIKYSFEQVPRSRNSSNRHHHIVWHCLLFLLHQKITR